MTRTTRESMAQAYSEPRPTRKLRPANSTQASILKENGRKLSRRTSIYKYRVFEKYLLRVRKSCYYSKFRQSSHWRRKRKKSNLKPDVCVPPARIIRKQAKREPENSTTVSCRNPYPASIFRRHFAQPGSRILSESSVLALQHFR